MAEMRIGLSNGKTTELNTKGTVEEFVAEWKAALKSGQVIVTDVGGRRRFLNPHHIVSIDE